MESRSESAHQPPVTASDPLVEAQYMVGENGAIVVLVNWRPRAIDKLIVRFPGDPESSFNIRTTTSRPRR